jgi:hypothetical protein
MSTQHNWPGTSPHLRLVPMSEEEREAEVAANHSRYTETVNPIRTRSTDAPGMRLAPLRQSKHERRRKPVPVGGGWLRKVRLALRDTVRYVLGSRA